MLYDNTKIRFSIPYKVCFKFYSKICVWCEKANKKAVCVA